MGDQLTQNLFGAIDSLAKRNIAATPADLTITGSVINIADISAGEYKVSYDGGTFSAYSLDPNIAYKKNDKLYILVPSGDFSAKKIILGYAARQKNKDDAQQKRMTNRYIPVGPNWLSKTWYAPQKEELEIVAGPKDEILATPNHGNWEDAALVRGADTANLNHIESLLRHYSSGLEWFKVQADFKTNFMSVHSNGRYGLRVELIVENAKFLSLHKELDILLLKLQKKRISEGEYTAEVGKIKAAIQKIKDEHPGQPEYQNEYFLEEYDLTFDNFNGNPYNLPEYMTQSAYFKVPKGAVRGLNRVILFQDGKMEGDELVVYNGSLNPTTNTWEPEETNADGTLSPSRTKDYVRNNIFAKNISIQWQQKVNLLDNLYHCWIETPRGDSLFKPGTGNATFGAPSVDLIAHLYYGYESVMNPNHCKVHWFREKLDYTEGKYISEAERIYPTDPKTKRQNPADPFGENHLDRYKKRYIDYSGPGWVPLQWLKDDPTNYAANDPMNGDNYKIDFNKLTVNIDAVPYKWRYQAVVVYKGDVIMRAFQTVRRLDSELALEIEHIIPENKKGQSLRIKDLMRPPGEIDAASTAAHNPAFNPANPGAAGSGQIDRYPEWWGRWWVDYGSMQYYTYLGLIDQDGSNDLAAIQGPINIDDLLTNERLIFKVQVYGIPGAGQIPGQRVPALPSAPPSLANLGPQYSELANIEYKIVKEDGGSLLTWYGERSFFYNTDGSIQSTDATIEHTAYAKPEWTGKTGLNYELVYIAPDGAVIGSADSIIVNPQSAWNRRGAEQNSVQKKSMMTDVWCDANKVLHFKVRDIYDNEKVENTWTARLIFSDGTIVDSIQDFQFAAPGDRGSNGSEWKAPIAPTNQIGIGNTLPFTQEITGRPTPIILQSMEPVTSFEEVDWNNLIQWGAPKNRLVLRPFVRHATYGNVESLLSGGGTTPDSCYFYKVYWEAHYPADNLNKGSNEECLPFADSPISKTGWLAFKHLDPSGGFTAVYSGDNEGGVIGKIRTSETPDLEANQGRRAYTQYTGKPEDHFGAIEVVFNPPKTGITAAQCNYHFGVKARIEIYRCSPTDRPVTYNSPQWTLKDKGLVTVINTSYPVDFLVTPTPGEFNKDLIYTNWPTEIKYNPSGLNPRTVTEELRFVYGPRAADFLVEFDNKKNLSPVNLTPLSQTVVANKNYQYDKQTKKSFWDNTYTYKLEPKTYSDWNTGRNGALCVDLAPGDNDKYGWYVRNQLIRLDIFGGNGSINGWDGKSVDINNGKGHILAPTMGAGWKDSFTNTFTGVVMGIDTAQQKSADKYVFNNQAAPANLNTSISQQKYMTGLYGYQQGVSSFGIMENGTAYFGRADGGGRLIIDGSNAQIYGGWNINTCDDKTFNYANDCLRTGGMWNRMRLNFLNHQGGTSFGQQANLIASGSVGNDNIKKSIPAPTDQYYQMVKKFSDLFNKLNGWDGYYATQQAGAPAIEVGQYCPSDLVNAQNNNVIDLCTYNNEYAGRDFLKHADIPGYRRFLVTYDGNLYAMNAFIKGTMIGSNIIGSQFLSKDGNFAVSEHGNMGIGLNKGLSTSWKTIAESQQDLRRRWSKYIPYEEDVNVRQWFNDDVSYKEYDVCGPYNFFVSKGGKVIANSIAIRGGYIDIGSFHVTDRGDLINFGRSYFVGGYTGEGNTNPNATPPDGTFGIGNTSVFPESKYGRRTVGEPAVDIWGDLYGRGGFFNLGNVYLGGSIEKFKKTSASPGSTSYMPASFNSPVSVEVSKGTSSDYGNLRTPVRGAFWPLHFYCSPAVNEFGRGTAAKKAAWVNMPTSNSASAFNDFMPNFASRYYSGASEAFSELGPHVSGSISKNFLGKLGRSSLFRVDGSGLWSDMILMRRFYPGASKMPSRTRYTGDNTQSNEDNGYIQDYNAMDNAELFLGVLTTYSKIGDTSYQTEAFGIKNISVGAPSFVIQTPLHLRFTAGENDNFIVDPGGTGGGVAGERRAEITLAAKPPGQQSGNTNGTRGEIRINSGDSGTLGAANQESSFRGGTITQISGVVALMARREGGGNSLSDVFLRMNTSSYGWDSSQGVANYNFEKGLLWAKGRSVILDAMNGYDNINDNNNFSASVRLNRDFDGNTSGPDNQGIVRIGADKTILIKPLKSGTTVKLRVQDIKPENQHGIYARFG